MAAAWCGALAAETGPPGRKRMVCCATACGPSSGVEPGMSGSAPTAASASSMLPESGFAPGPIAMGCPGTVFYPSHRAPPVTCMRVRIPGPSADSTRGACSFRPTDRSPVIWPIASARWRSIMRAGSGPLEPEAASAPDRPSMKRSRISIASMFPASLRSRYSGMFSSTITAWSGSPPRAVWLASMERTGGS